jgi:peptidoglycan/xylan/chitin deacetylase (PgdA/CDA1 family)
MPLSALRGRPPAYLGRRAASLSRRYGLTDGKAIRRLRRCVENLQSYGVSPTFATPGRVIERAPGFFRELAARGVELALHGYDHVDFRTLEPAEARRQFECAAAAFERSGISFDGFRCPYLSYTDALADVVQLNAFEYSSNKAIAWDVLPGRTGGATYAQLGELYAAARAVETVSMPWTANGLIEIPVSLPDDLQLLDGFGFRGQSVTEAWLPILEATHRRGELFAPLFHPETFDLIRVAMEGVIERALTLRPRVWMAQLREIARWSKEGAAFAATTTIEERALRIDLDCSSRATVLVRDWPDRAGTTHWHDRYDVTAARTLRIASDVRPFVGLADVDVRVARFLREQGYILDDGPQAPSCTVCVSGDVAVRNQVELVDYIESTAGPLLKFSRWPDGARSALCFAGDLDALSLRDYASRLLPR